MADPFDVLRHRDATSVPASPDPAFRSALMAELERALTRDDALPSVFATGSEPVPLEVIVSSPPSPSAPAGGPNRRLLAVGLAAAAVVALIVTGVLVTRDDDVEPIAALPVGTDSASPDAVVETSIDATVAPTTTIALTTTVAPNLPPPSDGEIAAAGLLSEAEVGDGYLLVPDTPTFTLERVGGPGTTSPACLPFLETVFESAARPATVDVRSFRKPGAMMQQYVVVFADIADAKSMMSAVHDPAFPACLGAVVTDAYTANDPPEIIGRSALVPADPRPLEEFGDDMVVLRVVGTYEFGGTTYDDDGLFPFVRVGRAVTWMNPASSDTAAETPGYPDGQLEQALEAAVAHLRVAQGS